MRGDIFDKQLINEMVEFANKTSFTYEELRPKSSLIDKMNPLQDSYQMACQRLSELAKKGIVIQKFGYLDGKQVMHKGKDRRLLLT